MTNFSLIKGEDKRIEYQNEILKPRIIENFQIFMNYFNPDDFIANPSLSIEKLTPNQKRLLANNGLRYFNVFEYEAIAGVNSKFLILGYTPESILDKTELDMHKVEDFFVPVETNKMFRSFNRDQIIKQLISQQALPKELLIERTPMLLNSNEAPLVIACFTLSFD